MAEHNELGKTGEDAAVAYLEQHGFSILHRNWRMKHLELDIIAEKEGEVVFVEVKTRRDTQYNEPHEAVDGRKMRRIAHAANAYIRLFRIDNPIRFDIVAVVGQAAPFRITHIEDAFYPPLQTY
ncbi:MAG: YraN family protein [Prevotellaceae bacterium]|jgi:putative endonuclease|nr:YraN family protein [Prevotellaceae bacterium]